MVFDYNGLKQAAKEGSRLGNWKSLPVFSCARLRLSHKGNGAYYIVYDDDNALVKKTGDNWSRYGYVDKDGGVHEESSGIYPINSKPQVPKPQTTTYSVIPSPGKTEAKKRDEVVADVRTEIDVEATLKRAREMTVEDLLEGFNYGL